tara:strand:+ start:138 stop:785 length:648 start_codon:yes stop_codon:yes gene_type:complete
MIQISEIAKHAVRSSCLFIVSCIILTGSTNVETNKKIKAHENEIVRIDVDEVIFDKRSKLSSYWLIEPNVRLCKESGVKEVRARRAIKYWERLGYRFGRIIVERETAECRAGGKKGEISILLVTSDIPLGDNLAMTRTHKDSRTLENIKSQIYIMPYSAEKQFVLEHEIGHALGWKHVNKSYHIMNSNYKMCGHSSTSVDYKSYIKKTGDIIADQ